MLIISQNVLQLISLDFFSPMIHPNYTVPNYTTYKVTDRGNYFVAQLGSLTVALSFIKCYFPYPYSKCIEGGGGGEGKHFLGEAKKKKRFPEKNKFEKKVQRNVKGTAVYGSEKR